MYWGQRMHDKAVLNPLHNAVPIPKSDIPNKNVLFEKHIEIRLCKDEFDIQDKNVLKTVQFYKVRMIHDKSLDERALASQMIMFYSQKAAFPIDKLFQTKRNYPAKD